LYKSKIKHLIIKN